MAQEFPRFSGLDVLVEGVELVLPLVPLVFELEEREPVAPM